jgi:hypothetical protein
MADKITFRAEIEFQGTAEELEKVISGVNKLAVRLVVDKFPLPFPYPGGWPIPLFRVLPKDLVNKLAKDRVSFPSIILNGINGGIRDPHLHIKDQVTMLDREEFGQVVGMAAESIGQELAAETGYQQTIGALRELNDFTTVR